MSILDIYYLIRSNRKINSALLLFCALLLLPGIASSQNRLIELDSNSYFAAIAKIEVVRNNSNLIPFVGLQSRGVATYFDDCMFQSAMDDEALYFHPVIKLVVRPDGFEESDITIIGIEKGSDIDAGSLNDLLSRKKVIVLLFDSTALNSYPRLMDADVVIRAYGQDEISHRLAIQMVFGGINENGVDGIRLAPGSAEAMGMDLEFLDKMIDSIAGRAIAKRACPGMQVLVARKGKIVFQKSYGYHTYDKIRPVNNDNIYDLASITKATSVLPALMQLYGQGRFDLSATLADYLPSFSHSNKGDLEWRQILAHNARLKAWIPYWRKTKKRNGKFRTGTFKYVRSERFPTVITDSLFLHRNYKKKIYKAIKKSKLNEEPGYVYSGLSFYLLPEIVANLTGREFEAYLKQEIYEKIGAYTITYNPLRYFTKDRIIPTERDTFFRMTQIHGRVHDEGAAMMGGVSGNAGLFATAGDLAKLAQLYLNRGTYGGESIIEAAVVDEFTRCQYCEEGNHRGLGFDKPAWSVDPDATSVSISKKASQESYGHSGYTGTLMWIDPKEELIFIFLSNRVYQTRLNRKLYTENIRPAIHDAIYSAIMD